VVFGIRTSLAQQLGFVGRDVTVKEILDAIRVGKLKFMMTSATQSNSGASAYLGFLYALSGNPEVLTSTNLNDAGLKDQIRDLLGGINRSSGSSGWLKDLFLQGGYDAMVNYEALIIEANQTLTSRGEEPLYLVYPVDGLVIADSPLGYIGKGDSKKEQFFLKLQEYLLSPEVQKTILDLGRRTGLGGVVTGANQAVFDPAWGIDIDRILSPITLPSPEVITEALTLYQTAFRKPSFTVYCLDFSGSMAGEGESQLKQAMALLLDPDEAGRYLLQPGPDDVTVFIAFDDTIIDKARVVGNDPAELRALLQRVQALSPDGSTDIYGPVIEGSNEIAAGQPDEYITAIVLMTDGQSNAGKAYSDLQAAWSQSGLEVPVFPIQFGEASVEQLDPIAALTRGKVFDGRTDLIQTFRDVKGYNN
jgi:Ca-activated chloride channel family protein